MPADGLIIDALNRVSHHSDQLEKILNNLYFQAQQSKAIETPGTFRVRTIWLRQDPSPDGLLQDINIQAFQLVPNNPRRRKISIFNDGPDALAISPSPFTWDSVQAMIVQTNTNSSSNNAVIDLGYLLASDGVQNIDIQTTSAIWGFNFNTEGEAAGQNNGTLVHILEENYISDTSHNPQLAGLDGLLHQGYMPSGLKNIK